MISYKIPDLFISENGTRKNKNLKKRESQWHGHGHEPGAGPGPKKISFV